MTATLECTHGLASYGATITCANGRWVGQGACPPAGTRPPPPVGPGPTGATCGLLPTVVNGRYTALNGRGVGTTATLGCNYGFQSSGLGVTKTCTGSGNYASWTPPNTGSCVSASGNGVSTCPSLPVLNGRATYYTEQGQSSVSPSLRGYAQITCNANFNPSSPNNRQTCSTSGTAGMWSGPPVSCVPSTAACPAITVTRGVVHYDLPGFGPPNAQTRRATINCAAGQHLASGAVLESRACVGGQWSPVVPGNSIMCTAPQQQGGASCPALEALHGTVAYDTGSLTAVTRGATVTCESLPFGTVYKTITGGESTHVNCELGQNGVSYVWSFPAGRTANTLCVEFHAQSEMCQPLTIPNGHYMYSNGQTEESTATLVCNPSMVSSNPTVPPRVCHLGQWSPSYPPLTCMSATGGPASTGGLACQALMVAGGTISYTDLIHAHASIAHVTCNTGSTVSNWMHPTQTCGSQAPGQWSTPAVTCVQNGGSTNPFGPPPPPTQTGRCSALPVLHGTVTYNGQVAGAASYGTGEVASIQCNPYYTTTWIYSAQNRHPSRTCTNGVWSGIPISCTGSGLAPPSPTNPFGPPPPPVVGPPCAAVMMNGGTARYSTTPTAVLGRYSYSTGTVATVTCEVGYIVSTGYGTTETQLCSSTGQWTAQLGGPPPTCIIDGGAGGVCASDPCGEYGTCRESPGSVGGYRCACLTQLTTGAQYLGDTCKCLSSQSTCMHGTPTAVEPTFAGGQCTWTCNCAGSGYSGQHCEGSSIHPSTGVGGCNAGSIPTCSNGGTCTAFSIMGASHTQCQCATGWSGDTCTVSGGTGTSSGGNTGINGGGTGATDSCSAMPCQNGGTCIDVFGHFSCTCAAGYGGDTCLEHDTVNDCVHGANPCQHGGICADSFFGFTCQCGTEPSQVFGQPPVEWGGLTCSTSSSGQDNCASQPCMHGGVCQSLFLGNDWTYKCTCPSNVFGTHCEQTDFINDCINFDCCGAGGNCVDLFQSATCTCNPGYSGTSCNTRASPYLTLTAGECDSGSAPAPPQTGGGSTATARLGCTHTGASTCRQGRIEVFNPSGNEWGTVCGHWMWDNDNVANIVCRQLGFAYGTLYTFGVTTQLQQLPVVWGFRRCAGTEASIFQCPQPDGSNPSDPTCNQHSSTTQNNPFGTNNACTGGVDTTCTHAIDQGAVCYSSTEPSQLMPSMAPCQGCKYGCSSGGLSNEHTSGNHNQCASNGQQCAAGQCAAAGAACQPVVFGCIDFYSAQCTYDATSGGGSYDAALAEFAACSEIVPEPQGYCHGALTTAGALRNQDVCLYGSQNNIAFHIRIPFHVFSQG